MATGRDRNGNPFARDADGTEWKFEYAGGSFGIQFKADGYNHFNCPAYPEHAHYTLDTHGTGNSIDIDWGKYGQSAPTPPPELRPAEPLCGRGEAWESRTVPRLQPCRNQQAPGVRVCFGLSSWAL